MTVDPLRIVKIILGIWQFSQNWFLHSLYAFSLFSCSKNWLFSFFPWVSLSKRLRSESLLTHVFFIFFFFISTTIFPYLPFLQGLSVLSRKVYQIFLTSYTYRVYLACWESLATFFLLFGQRLVFGQIIPYFLRASPVPVFLAIYLTKDQLTLSDFVGDRGKCSHLHCIFFALFS